MLRNFCKDKAYSKMNQEASSLAESPGQLQTMKSDGCFNFSFFH
jgi:hypothetical protein